MHYKIVNFKQRPDLYDSQQEICRKTFPTFLYYSEIIDSTWDKMIEYYQEYQLLFLNDEEIICIFNCMPMSLDFSDEELPEDAFDWGMEKGIRDFEDGKEINAALAIQIIIPKEYQGKGISHIAVVEIKNMCAEMGIQKLVIPVRPTLKCKYPINDIGNYIKWKNEKGLPFDPWLRVHVKQNGKIIKPCKEALKIKGTIKQWENWTKMSFPESGMYVVDGALCPVRIDREKNIGFYIEPNVWVSYEISD